MKELKKYKVTLVLKGDMEIMAEDEEDLEIELDGLTPDDFILHSDFIIEEIK